MRAIIFAKKTLGYWLALPPMLYAATVLLASVPAHAQFTYNGACNTGWQFVNMSEDCWPCVKNGLSYQCYQRCDHLYCEETDSYMTSCYPIQYIPEGALCPPD